jgi:hypothetical protein
MARMAGQQSQYGYGVSRYLPVTTMLEEGAGESQAALYRATW